MKKRVAIIGTGISGLSLGKMLKDFKNFEVTLFEKSDRVGGLIKCSVEDGTLFHRVGGHVFNSKNEKVKDWFFSFFDKSKEFLSATRLASIWMNNKYIGYPLENNLYELETSDVNKIIRDLLGTPEQINFENDSFQFFLQENFGKTLYELYFKPYNEKIWNTDLSGIPLNWLDGKLPMPDRAQIIATNITRGKETKMVHSTFFYPVKGGSSFIADRLKDGLNIVYNKSISQILESNGSWIIDKEKFDLVVYTGDVRKLINIISNVQKPSLISLLSGITKLKSNGTTTILCESGEVPFSWVYLPESNIKPHRIIYTGNFSPNNNGGNKLTCTVEFCGFVSKEEVYSEIKKLPGTFDIISYNYEPNSYVIQDFDTRDNIKAIKEGLEKNNFFLLGRFAEWEYYNMDKAIEAAMDLVNNKLIKYV